MNAAHKFSSPLRGEVAERSEAGGGVKKSPPPNPSPQGRGNKPFTKTTQQNAKRLRNQLTEAEKKLWYFLRNKQMGAKFRRQQPVGSYIVDFISFDVSLIIERDGGQHSGKQSYDKTRDAFLQKEGFNVLRFWNNEVMENIDGVLERIISSHPLLTSPLQGEELRAEGV